MPRIKTNGELASSTADPQGLSDAELEALERDHPEGFSTQQVVDLFAARGARISEATFRKYVQLGLLPRSVRVGRKGKHQGSQGLYPTSVVRQLDLIRRLMARVRRCAARRPLLICTDGLVSYIRAIRETFRDPIHTGKGGRPRRRPWRHICIAQVVKRYERRRVVETERRLVDGTPARGLEWVELGERELGHGVGLPAVHSAPGSHRM